MAPRNELHLSRAEVIKGACRIVVGVYAVLCLGSLALVPLSGAGAFGLARDPLSGVFAIVLGLPWTMLSGMLVDDFGTWTGLLVVAAGMAINGFVMTWLCRRLRGDRKGV